MSPEKKGLDLCNIRNIIHITIIIIITFMKTFQQLQGKNSLNCDLLCVVLECLCVASEYVKVVKHVHQ